MLQLGPRSGSRRLVRRCNGGSPRPVPLLFWGAAVLPWALCARGLAPLSRSELSPQPTERRYIFAIVAAGFSNPALLRFYFFLLVFSCPPRPTHISSSSHHCSTQTQGTPP